MIGKMDRRIHVEKRDISRVDGVKVDNGWTRLETVYGSVEPMTGYERRIAEQNGLIVSHKVTMRYRSNLGVDNTELLPEHRLIIDNIVHEVRQVLNRDFRNMWYDILTEARI